MKKIIRVATHSGSLGNLLKGQMQFMSAHYEIIGVGSAGDVVQGKSTIETLAETEGIRVVPIEMTRKITPFLDLIAVYQLYKLFKREKPFIVHSHTPKAGLLSMLAARMAKVPHRLHTVAGLPLVEAVGIKRRLLNFIEKITYACATMVYPNSAGLKDIIINNEFTDEEKLKIIGKGSSNGIDTAYFAPSKYTESERIKLRAKFGIDSSSFVYIFLGRIVKDKGINELVKAFTNIQKEYNEVILLIVGYFNEATAALLPETVQEIKTNKGIQLIGWQQDVRPYLAIADVLTFPSYREGFPNTVLQASAMQVPSIVSDINGCNEIIQEGVNGLVIPVKNTEALQEAMQRLRDDAAYYKVLVENSRHTICQNYERRYVWESLLREYKLLENN